MVLIYVRSRAEFIKYKSYSVNVMFTGSNCPACVASKPYFEALAQRYHGNFMIVDRVQLQLSDSDIGFSIAGVPTFVKYRSGQPVSTPFAGLDYAKMESMVKA